jgi:fumarylpyruvate hydrolase
MLHESCSCSLVWLANAAVSNEMCIGSSMPKYVFAPSPVVAVPVRGREDLYPVRRIFCVGRNFEAHAREMGTVPDREAPFYFTKAATAYVPTGSTVSYPTMTNNYHYEMELVVAIGSAAFQVSIEDAPSRIFGYACGLDMTRRDLQFIARDKKHPWDVAKDFEESAVLSPIVPVSDIGHPVRNKIELRVNGIVKQSSDVSLLIHSVPAIIADLSKYYHLLPGDLIYTGTPEGVGPVHARDDLVGSIEHIGDIALHIA